MSIGVIFWLFMIIWLVFGIVGVNWPDGGRRIYFAHGLFLFILLFLLGWGVFGFIVKGP